MAGWPVTLTGWPDGSGHGGSGHAGALHGWLAGHGRWGRQAATAWKITAASTAAFDWGGHSSNK